MVVSGWDYVTVVRSSAPVRGQGHSAFPLSPVKGKALGQCPGRAGAMGGRWLKWWVPLVGMTWRWIRLTGPEWLGWLRLPLGALFLMTLLDYRHILLVWQSFGFHRVTSSLYLLILWFGVSEAVIPYQGRKYLPLLGDTVFLCNGAVWESTGPFHPGVHSWSSLRDLTPTQTSGAHSALSAWSWRKLTDWLSFQTFKFQVVVNKIEILFALANK